MGGRPEDSADETAGSRGSELSALIERITAVNFDEWHNERQHAQNIREGKPWRNTPRQPQLPRRHRPHQLLQCHRKTTYQQRRAPEEQDDPRGIFWFGTKFENEIVMEFLDDFVVGTDEFVRNSIWVEFTVRSDAGELHLKGSTDPVIVDRDSRPLLLTEIKTRSSLENVDSPSVGHRAQVHAYLYGLSQQDDRNHTHAVLIYGSRSSLQIKSFTIEFDPWFWRHTVLQWAAQQTQYRLDDELPPAEPRYPAECNYCSYRERCGKGETEVQNLGPLGFVPYFRGYPREKIVEYLEGHHGDDVYLTPTLAHQYPDLGKSYEVAPLVCDSCGDEFKWDEIKWEVARNPSPPCPNCSGRRHDVYLSEASRTEG